MDFSSDTSAPAHPAVIEALAAINHGYAASYGADAISARLRNTLSSLLETEAFDFWLCASGTASNALALSVMCGPTGAIACHAEAHIERDERGAPEFFSGGAKLRLLPGPGAQIDEAALRDALSGNDPGFVHETPLETLSLTNLTECGTAYSVEQVTHLSALAKSAGLNVHLDGARLANALVTTGATVSQMSWKAGIDCLTLGLTKTGAVGCEIILLFGDLRDRFDELRARAKRSGHMPPKMRYLAAQAEALLGDGLWLSLASDANQKAQDLANRLCAAPGVQLAYAVQGNEVFCHLPPTLAERMSAAKVRSYTWPGGSHRFVCSWATSQSEIETLGAVLAQA